MNDDRSETVYSIGDVSELVGLKPHVLRYWEKEFDVLSPRKNEAGQRIYAPEDVAVVRRIQHLLKVEKYTIAGARQVFRREDESPDSPSTRRELLRLRAFLTELMEKV